MEGSASALLLIARSSSSESLQLFKQRVNMMAKAILERIPHALLPFLIMFLVVINVSVLIKYIVFVMVDPVFQGP